MTHNRVVLLTAACIIAITSATTSGTSMQTPAPRFAEIDRKAAAGEPLSVVFFGGSITWGANASDPQRTSWRALMGEYLRQKYPRCPLSLHDAAIGGTGSQLGLFRTARDVLPYKPDLVFLDFTLNDGLYKTDAQNLDSYESILRELIGHGIAVEQVFVAGRSEFLPKYQPDQIPRLVAHQKLAAAYGTAVGDVYPAVHAALCNGSATSAQVWPFDGTHPDDPGYRLFFEAVRDGYEKAVKDGRVCRVPSAAVFGDTYTAHQRIRLVDMPLPVGWTRAKTFRTSMWFDGLSSRWMDDVAMFDGKEAPAARPLTIEFTGTFAAVFGEADQDGLGFTATVDGKPLLEPAHGKMPAIPAWTFRPPQPGRLFEWRVLSDSLPPGKHTLVLQPVVPVGTTKGQLRIESVCVAGNE